MCAVWEEGGVGREEVVGVAGGAKGYGEDGEFKTLGFAIRAA